MGGVLKTVGSLLGVAQPKMPKPPEYKPQEQTQAILDAIDLPLERGSAATIHGGFQAPQAPRAGRTLIGLR